MFDYRRVISINQGQNWMMATFSTGKPGFEILNGKFRWGFPVMIFPKEKIHVGFWFLAGISIQEVNWRLETEPFCLCGSDQERNGRVQPQPTEGS